MRRHTNGAVRSNGGIEWNCPEQMTRVTAGIPGVSHICHVVSAALQLAVAPLAVAHNCYCCIPHARMIKLASKPNVF
jgi:hypothetical protein